MIGKLMVTRFRAAVALILLAIFAVFSIGSGLRQIPIYGRQVLKVRQTGDDLSHWSSRLAPLLAYLPETGLIGYITEENIPGLIYSEFDLSTEWAMSQNVLAPRILVHGSDQPLVVGNLGSLTAEQIPDAVAPLGLELERSFGFGIYLLRRVSR